MVTSTNTSLGAGNQRAQTEEERAYYKLNRFVWNSWFPSVYEPVTAPFRLIRPEVARVAGVTFGSNVLDVATGTGAQARAFAAAGADVVGVDIAEGMLSVARKKSRSARVRFEQADATALSFPDGTFDVASISFALHEMPRTIRVRVLNEMRRVTRRSGRIVIVDYGLPKNALAATVVYRFVKLYERDHYAEFVRSDWHALLRDAGLEAKDERWLLGGNVRVVVGVAGVR